MSDHGHGGHKSRKSFFGSAAEAIAKDIIEKRKEVNIQRRRSIPKRILKKVFPLHTLEPFRLPETIYPPDPATMSPAEYRRAKEAYEHYNAFATRHPFLAAGLVFIVTAILWQFI